MIKHCLGRRHYYLLVLMLTFVSHSIFAQVSFTMSKWRYSDPKPLGFTVLDVKFFDNNFGIAVGGSGGIARTFNGGAKWEYGTFTFTSPAGLTTNGAFSDISVPSSTVAYVVGSNGMMAKTVDAAQTWSFVRTPLYANSRNINTCWFLDKDNGYIAGQWNTADSIPKIYRTRDGGNTWDSLAAPPINGKSRVGYISNVNLPSVLWDVDGKAKEIYRIQFINDSVGYACGSAASNFPRVGPSATLATCLPNTGNLTTSAHSAALLWKITKNGLIDYSLSKERLGYTGINTNTVNCTTSYNAAGVAPAVQTYRAMAIINDSTVVMMSFNNNTVVKVSTGKNDSTANINAPGTYEKGKYQILNFPFPPTGGPNAGPAIPPVQVLLASNPYKLKKAANGKLFAAANFGYMWTSVDTGRNWKQEYSLPQGRNYSSFATWAMDILPNGRFITMGQGGVVADSTPGGSFQSNYVVVGSTGNKVDFVDCANGIVAGGSQIAVTTTGGKSWIPKHRPDFANSFYSINGFHYTSLNKCYFAVSNGILYSSTDQATTLDPVYSDFNFQMNDVVGFGANTIYGLGYSQFSVAAASRKSSFFRSTNGGLSWQTIDIVSSTATPAFTAPTLSKMVFPSVNVGYASGSRNGVYKTTDGGLTWTRISPFPALNEAVNGSAYTTYTGIYALDDNTVYVLGNIFTTAGFKRLYKTTDGGATWTDISNNMNTLLPVGNMLNVMFHDQNNGYVIGSNVVFTTTNGGASWSMEVAPHGNLNNALGFAPRTVSGTTPFANRKVFIAGLAITNAIPTIMEYGDTLNVNVNSTEVVTASCSNTGTGTITITATGAIAPYTYRLNNGTPQTSNKFTGLAAGTYTITVFDAACGSLTKQVTVGLLQSPLVNAGVDRTIITGDVITLDGFSSNTLTAVAWSPATSIVSGGNTLRPLVNPAATTNYAVTVTDVNGCTGTDNALITVLPYCIRIKDAFTPNGDGINDRWVVTGGSNCTTQVTVSIFNRYGGVVYSNQNYQNDWDGNYKGKPVPDGTYYYVVSAKLINGETHQYKGDVTILR